MTFRYSLRTSLERAALLEHLEHGVAAYYFWYYVQNKKRNQVTQSVDGVAAHGVAAWLLIGHQFPRCRAKRVYVPEMKANQSEQT